MAQNKRKGSETTEPPVAASSDMDNIEETMQQLLDVREHYHHRVHNNIRIAQERQKKNYDAKHDSNHVMPLSFIN